MTVSSIKLSRVLYASANTWTGSVTFGAGSDDPPPNNVEMVLPSSKPEKKRCKVKGQSSGYGSTLKDFIL